MSILALDRINVSFGGLHALRDVSLRVEEGEIHGLIGPNGAGKTTLINVLSRFIQPRSGAVEFNGRPLPARADRLRAAGIARTFQTPAVFPELTALENVMLGAFISTSAGLVDAVRGSRKFRDDERRSRSLANDLLERVGFDGDSTAYASKLSFGNLRKVESARALMCDPILLLLDEPTAGFSRAEVESFAQLLRNIHADSGKRLTILLVEHNVPLIFGLCDRVTALDNGDVVGHGTANDVRNDPAVIRSYLGSGAALGRPRTPTRSSPSQTDVSGVAKPCLVAESLTAGYGSVTAVRRIDLSVASGEVVAVFGRNGAGKSTLFNALVRTIRPSAGRVRWLGERIDALSTEAIVRLGIGLVPQDRGVIERQTVADNLRLAGSGLSLGRAEVERRLSEIYTRFPRLAERKHQLGGRLSGGERRMLAIAKALMRRPALLLLDEPSIGLAGGVVQELHDVVAQINGEGTAVLIAEQNVRWVIPLAQRGYVLDTGAIVQEGGIEQLTAVESLRDQFLGRNA